MPRPFSSRGIKTTAVSVKCHIKDDITNIKMLTLFPFDIESYVIQTVNDSFNIASPIALFICDWGGIWPSRIYSFEYNYCWNEGSFGLSTYYIHYVMKRFPSVIYMWTLYRYVSLRDYLEVCSSLCWFWYFTVVWRVCTTSKQRNIRIQHVSTFKNMTSSLNYITAKLRTFFAWGDSNILPTYSKS